MGDWAFHLRRRIRATARNLRELRLTAYGAVHTDHPIMAHIIPIRRCNLACEYCNEYDDFSKPVPSSHGRPDQSPGGPRDDDRHAQRWRTSAASRTRRHHRGACAAGE